MWLLYMMHDSVKINKHIGEISVIQFYGRLKELFDFNKLAKLIYMIILEYFIMNDVTKYVVSYNHM